MAQEKKASNAFEDSIAAYLTQRAETEPSFAIKLSNPKKSIPECCQFIINQVYKSKCNGLTDEEVYNLATHYYDEDDIEIGKSIQCHVVVNHEVVLTEEEKAEAKRRAIEKLTMEETERLHRRDKKTITPKIATPSIFDEF